MHLDAKDAVPLYQQLTNIIIADISNGIYKSGDKIPTEQELGEKYNVSRVTVRSALAELSERNILVRRRGKGTYINGDKINKSIVGVRSFSDLCREIGCKPGAKVLKCIIEKATPEDIAALQLEENANILVTERIRFADDVPVSFEVSRFPERFSFLLHEDLNDSSMFEIIREKHGITFGASSKMVELTYATYEIAVYLQLPKEYPLLLITSVSCDNDNAPAHRSFQYIVGDKFKLIV